MAELTITEALAEIKMIQKRVEKKIEQVRTYGLRQDCLRDPLEKDGGSRAVCRQELQAIRDLMERQILIRTKISQVNRDTLVAVDGLIRTVESWLIWKREVARKKADMLAGFLKGLEQAREEAKRKGWAVMQTGQIPERPTDVIVNLDERGLTLELEELEALMERLDGKLSLSNATAYITMPD
jgi:hypothetical protein